MTKPQLICHIETTKTVSASDLSSFIKEATGHTYDVVSQEDMTTGNERRYFITGELKEYSQKFWDDFKNTGNGFPYNLNLILNGLCHDSFIERGIYYVNGH